MSDASNIEIEIRNNSSVDVADVVDDYAAEQARQYKEEARQYAENAQNSQNMAEAWAESSDAPAGEGTRSGKTWADVARQWAESDSEPDQVEGAKSSKSWAEEAAQSASAAAASETNALKEEQASASSAKSAAESETAAKTAKEDAEKSAENAKSSAEAAALVAAEAKTTAEGITATAQDAKDIAQVAMTLADDAKDVAAEAKTTASGNLALTGGTMTGSIQYVENGKVFSIGNTDPGNVDLGWSWANREGAGLGLRSTDYRSPSGSPGEFSLYARDGSNSTELHGCPDGRLTWGGQPLLPVGIVQAFAGTTIPSGWLLCDGSAVSRTTYASLFSVIGTTYGSGNGSTTFNLPNLTDKFVEGSATAGTVKSAGLPNITGSFGLRPVTGGQNVTWTGRDGAIERITQTGDRSNSVAQGSAQGPLVRVTLDASRSSSIYGKSTTVQPPALTMRYIIKY